MTSQNKNDAPIHLNDLYHNSQSNNPNLTNNKTRFPHCALYIRGSILFNTIGKSSL